MYIAIRTVNPLRRNDSTNDAEDLVSTKSPYSREGRKFRRRRTHYCRHNNAHYSSVTLWCWLVFILYYETTELDRDTSQWWWYRHWNQCRRGMLSVTSFHWFPQPPKLLRPLHTSALRQHGQQQQQQQQQQQRLVAIGDKYERRYRKSLTSLLLFAVPKSKSTSSNHPFGQKIPIASSKVLSIDVVGNTNITTVAPTTTNNTEITQNKAMASLSTVTSITTILTSSDNTSRPTKLHITTDKSSERNTNNHDFRAKLRATQQQLMAAAAVANVENITFPPISQSYLDYLFAECVAHDAWDLAIIDVMDIMTKVQLTVQYSTYNACLQACFQTGNAGSAMQILQTMESSSNPTIQPQINDYTLVLLAMCRNDQTESGWCQKAIQLLDHVRMKTQQDVPITVYDAILACLIQERNWKMSVRILQSMEDRSSNVTNVAFQSTRPVLSTYRTVIECCVAANQGDVAYRVLKSYLQRIGPSQVPDNNHTTMPMMPMIPTSYLFEMVIVTLSKSTQQWRRAVQLLDHMLEWQVPRTLLIYNSILIACSKAREPIVAKSILQRMKRYDHRHISPNVISYNTVIAACCTTTNWRDALTIFDQMQREPGVVPDICTYTNVIRACVKGDKIDRAQSLIQVVKAKGLPLDSYFYTAAMEASDWSNALKLLHEMEANNIPPTEVSYSVTIKACGRSGQWERALELLDVMRSKKMKINIFVYNAAIGAIAKAAKQRIKSVDYNTGKSLSEKVLSLLSKMKSDGIEPDGFSYSSAMSCYGSEGQWEEAVRTIQEMRKGGPNVQPNKVAYTAAISSCGRSGQVNQAIQLFEQMQEQGHIPDTVAYNALFLTYRMANRTGSVLDLWNEMVGKARGATPARMSHTYIPSSSRVRPDIITVTEAIGSLSSDPDQEINLRHQIDQIIVDAVEFGILFRPSGTNSSRKANTTQKMSHASSSASSSFDNVYDLSCLSFPVARATCRYILMKQILPLYSQMETNETSIRATTTVIPDLMLITGSGLQHRLIRGSHNELNNNNISSSSSSDSGVEIHQSRSMFMREYVQYILLNDYGLNSFAADRSVAAVTPATSSGSNMGSTGGNVVIVKAETLKEWCLSSR